MEIIKYFYMIYIFQFKPCIYQSNIKFINNFEILLKYGKIKNINIKYIFKFLMEQLKLEIESIYFKTNLFYFIYLFLFIN